MFTFSNHPSHHFTPHSPTPLIYPPLQKAKLLGDYGADIVILTPFTPEFSQTSFDHFLHHLKKKLSFSILVLGTGATFGKHKEGNEENVKRLAPVLGFEVEYLPKFTLHNTPVSSGRIRSFISQGAFYDVQACLGRPYSLMAHLNAKEGGYFFPVEGLCLPPEGVYPVRLKTSSHEYLARAQILPKEHQISLKLLNEAATLLEKEVEVIFSSLYTTKFSPENLIH